MGNVNENRNTNLPLSFKPGPSSAPSIEKDPFHARITFCLPQALQTLNTLRSSTDGLTDVEALHVWELDYALFVHATALAEAITQQSLFLGKTASDSSHNDSRLLENRTSLLQSLRVLQQHIREALSFRVDRMDCKPRLYRLAEHLQLSEGEVRAFVFIVLSCAGVEVPGAEDRRQDVRTKAELHNCREFSGLEGHQLLDFLSPSRAHFAQGLLEVEDEFAASYPESKFRAPREVLKAIYGGTLTLDEAMTLGNSALSDVLAEETGSVLNGQLGVMPSTKPEKLRGIADVAVDQVFEHGPSARERTSDGTAMLDLLSELHVEDSNRLSTKAKGIKQNSPLLQGERRELDELKDDTENNGYVEDEDNGYCLDDEPSSEADIMPYEDDMQYLKDGFEVVQEACKVYNFREKNSEEDRYTSTKRPVEALQREADAKLRKATMHFTRRLNKTKQADGFMPRLELLVSKLKLAHFERMVILTLGTSIKCCMICTCLYITHVVPLLKVYEVHAGIVTLFSNIFHHVCILYLCL